MTEESEPIRVGVLGAQGRMGSEVLQGLPAIGRTTSVADWLADVVGVAAGLARWGRFAGRRRP